MKNITSLLVSATLLSIASFPAAQESQDVIFETGERVGAGVAAAVAVEPTVVVVALAVPPLMAEAVDDLQSRFAAIENIQDAVLADVPDAVELYRFQYVPGHVLQLRSVKDLDTLARNPNVLRVDLDVGGSINLAESVPLIGADTRYSMGNGGSGIKVAVLDSGIDSSHFNLAYGSIQDDQACFGWNGSASGVGFCPDGSDFQTGDGSAEDDQGHGTHVAGIVMSLGLEGGGYGVAPLANVIAMKVLDVDGFFYSFTLNVVAALDHIIANPQYGISVINMSLGTNALFSGDCDTATSWTMVGAAAVNTLRSSGVSTFASAGNNGSGTQMGAPGCLSNVISVGASDDLDGAASFSNSNSETDIFAPGVNIISSRLGGGIINFSGTSMASPTAAACAALLLETGEATSPDAIEARLQTSTATVRSYKWPEFSPHRLRYLPHDTDHC